MGVVPSQSLYCFAVVVMDTGSPKPSHEMELMNHQSENNLGIFQCEGHDVFSDTALTLSNGVALTQVFDTDGDWKFAKRKSTGAYVNTGIFSDVWRVIAREAKWQQSEWVVKVDPDAVFVPARLRKSLETTYEPAPSARRRMEHVRPSVTQTTRRTRSSSLIAIGRTGHRSTPSKRWTNGTRAINRRWQPTLCPCELSKRGVAALQ